MSFTMMEHDRPLMIFRFRRALFVDFGIIVFVENIDIFIIRECAFTAFMTAAVTELGTAAASRNRSATGQRMLYDSNSQHVVTTVLLFDHPSAAWTSLPFIRAGKFHELRMLPSSARTKVPLPFALRTRPSIALLAYSFVVVNTVWCNKRRALRFVAISFVLCLQLNLTRLELLSDCLR